MTEGVNNRGWRGGGGGEGEMSIMVTKTDWKVKYETNKN